MQAWVEQWLPGFEPGDENETSKGDERMGIVTTIIKAAYRDEHVGGPDFGRGCGDTVVCLAGPSASRKFKDYTKYQQDLMNPRIRPIENAVRESKKRACDVVLQIRDDLLAVRESILKADANTSLELVDTLLDNIENHISER